VSFHEVRICRGSDLKMAKFAISTISAVAVLSALALLPALRAQTAPP